ncbi:MAG: BACON domain-containing protein [Bacteroidales bacterium]|nr:BACON domain-containing protein [Bacteroidales bacterium]
MRTGHRFIAAALLLLAGCNPHQNDTPAAFISFGDMFDKTVGETAGTVTTVAFQAGGPWSARSNAAWLTATPDSGGAGDEVVRVEVTANETGRVRMGSVTFTCGSDKKTLHVTQNAGKVDPGTEPTYGPLLTDGFSQDLHYSTARLRTTSAVMQSFDIASDGMIYYTQLNSNFRVYLSWNERNSQETPTARCMTLCYTGHGSNFTLEEATDGKYIWIDNYSSKNNKGEYWNAQIISRIPVKAGVTVKASQTTENYYFGEKNISVAVDIEGDMLTILGISSGRIRTYRLSELKALPVRDITLEEITYGGESGSGDAEVTKKPVVKARDASKLKPLGEFAISRSTYADGTTVSWQGFDIHDGLVYQAQGNGHADGTPSPGWLQVRKIDGTTVIPLTKFRALDDLTALKAAGITDTGYMEPEGVKFRDGAVFCGFCSKNSENVRRGTLFRYDPQLVR